MSFWSKLGKVLKVAAPIAASFIPGVGPLAAMAIGAGGSAAGSALNKEGLKGSLINGLMGGATSGLGALAGGAGAAGAAGKAASGGIKGTIGRVGGSVLSGLMNPQTLQDMGRGVSAISKTQASNRGVELDAMMEADRARILNDRARREDESDIWKKMQAADYMKRGSQPTKPQMSASGRSIPQFDFGPAPISEGNKQMASTLEQQLMKRLNTVPQLRDYDSKMKPGTAESITGWAGPLMGGAGSIIDAMNRNKESKTTTEMPPIDPKAGFDPNADWTEGLRIKPPVLAPPYNPDDDWATGLYSGGLK